MIVSLAFLMLAAPAVSAGAAGSPTVESILAANQTAVGAMPPKGTLTLEYTQKQSGLTGTATHVKLPLLPQERETLAAWAASSDRQERRRMRRRPSQRYTC